MPLTNINITKRMNKNMIRKKNKRNPIIFIAVIFSKETNIDPFNDL